MNTDMIVQDNHDGDIAYGVYIYNPPMVALEDIRPAKCFLFIDNSESDKGELEFELETDGC